MQLPVDAERSPTSEFAVASTRCTTLDRASSSFDAKEQSELLGALVALLHRYTQQPTIALDVFVRDGSAERRLDADVPIAGDSSFSTVIEETRRVLASGSAGTQRSNVAVTLLLTPSDSATVESRAAVGVDPYDAHFVLGSGDGGRLLSVGYNVKLVLEATASRWLDGYRLLLAAATSEPDAIVEALPLLPPEQVRELSTDQDSGTASYPESPVHTMFEEHARRQPDALAAVCEGRSITYRELDERSNRLAHYLVTRGVEPEVPVAV
ncbi:MAG TPA: AMP-binding protein, partial [Polyangiaceae bacterium]|nr:AMP-binding protein [Polyangiaceae bacterium]